jgi:NADPH-dependent 7-cyano-7-deazaguanine reductase QueF
VIRLKIKIIVCRVSQNWRTNYLLPYRGCLNIHEKNMEKIFQTKKNQLMLLLLLTVIQCKQRYTRTSLPCNVTVVD